MDTERLTDYGQIKEGDLIVINAVFAKKPFSSTVRVVIRGGTDEEEIVYNRSKNYYFITSMVLDGSSQVKEVLIVK